MKDVTGSILSSAQESALEWLHGQCVERPTRGDTCVVYNMEADSAVRRIVAGWSLVLSLHVHGSTECWHLSSKLDPLGRGSTEEDWRVLGAIVAVVTGLSGYPKEAALPEAIPPIDGPYPNRAFHWSWHSDGSPVSEEYLETMRTFLARSDVETMGKTAAARLPTPGRNDPCPCGSGRKWKKCHGSAGAVS